MLSIGGNDLGFGDIITACVKGFLSYSLCHEAQQEVFDSKLTKAKADVGKAIDQVQAAMTKASYKPGSDKFVYQSYPSPLPVGAANR